MHNCIPCIYVYIHRGIHKKLRHVNIYYPGEGLASVLCYLKFKVKSGTTAQIQLQKWNTHLHIFTQRQNNGSFSLDLHPVPHQRVNLMFSEDFILKMRGGRQMDFAITLTVRYYLPMFLIHVLYHCMFFIHDCTYVPHIICTVRTYVPHTCTVTMFSYMYCTYVPHTCTVPMFLIHVLYLCSSYIPLYTISFVLIHINHNMFFIRVPMFLKPVPMFIVPVCM